MKFSLFDKPLFGARVNKSKAKLFPEGALGYLVGPILALVSNSFISSYLTKYYTDVLGLSTWAPLFLVLLQVLSVILVVAGNLLVGKFMNKMNTKAGKAEQSAQSHYNNFRTAQTAADKGGRYEQGYQQTLQNGQQNESKDNGNDVIAEERDRFFNIINRIEKLYD
jgi:hypothetical protein